MKQQLVTVQRQNCVTVERELIFTEYEEVNIDQESASTNIDIQENDAYAIPKHP